MEFSPGWSIRKHGNARHRRSVPLKKSDDGGREGPDRVQLALSRIVVPTATPIRPVAAAKVDIDFR